MKNAFRSSILFAILATSFVLAILIFFTQNHVATTTQHSITAVHRIATVKTASNSPTMKSLQKDLIAYLKKNRPEISFGSKKFVEYAIDVAVYDADPELAKLSNYEELAFYCAEYLHELDEQQVEGILPLIGFRPSKAFLDKTVEEIQTVSRNKNKLQELLYERSHSQQEASGTDNADDADDADDIENGTNNVE